MMPRAPVPPHVSLKRLTFDAGLEQYPALAPDGRTFLFVSNAAGNQDIYLQRVDGRNAINLTQRSPAADSQPAFSPDGSQIAFRSSRDGGGIFVMGATGESVRRLTDCRVQPVVGARRVAYRLLDGTGRAQPARPHVAGAAMDPPMREAAPPDR